MAMSHDQRGDRAWRPVSARLARSVLAIAMPIAVAGGLAAGCGSSGGSGSASAAQAHASTASGHAGAALSSGTAGPGSPAARSPASTVPAGASPAPSPPVTVLPVPAPAAGLHQTRALPSASTPVFRAEMTDLWAAVVTGRPAVAMPAFFPLVAYRQVKAIAGPAADWQDRLVGEFRLDVAAAHRLLGPRAGRAQLVSVLVPEAQASWISPGVCYNGVGYWHVAGPRLVYRLDGQLRSIGIASLISWRGLWYVVHFGAVIRPGPGGVVDQPAIGTGTPGPPGGC